MMTCYQINSEIAANNQRIQDLAREHGWKVAQNVAAGVAGIVIWPLWFGMDFQGAAAAEGAAAIPLRACRPKALSEPHSTELANDLRILISAAARLNASLYEYPLAASRRTNGQRNEASPPAPDFS
jgi:hypothetical protein